MKTIIQIVLWLFAIVLGYMIYNSVMGPVNFDKVKETRFYDAIASLKDIRNSQEACKTVTGKFAPNFAALESFVEKGQFVITSQRDSSYLEFDKAYGIDMLRQIKIVDTLDFVSVKDSLFKNSDRYKTMKNVPHAKNGEKFEMKSGIVEKNGFRASVFEAKVKKAILLHDQDKDYISRENVQLSVEQINGPEIIVGSLREVSTSGNWPPAYDRKKQ